jgi:hypothetical protein
LRKTNKKGTFIVCLNLERLRIMAKKLLHIIDAKDEIISTISFNTKKDLALFAKEIKSLSGLGYRLAVSELNV